MIYCGSIVVVICYGINCVDIGVFMCCFFEEIVEIFFEVVVVGEFDDCCGIFENVMFGQMVFMGIGYFEVFFDFKMLEIVIFDNFCMGFMVGMIIKGNQFEGVVIFYDIGLFMVDNGYFGGFYFLIMGNFFFIVGNEFGGLFGFVFEYGGGGYGFSLVNLYVISFG